jgi:hypothetical protein
MTAAIIVSSITIVGLVASFITVFDKEGTNMFKDKNNKEE